MVAFAAIFFSEWGDVGMVMAGTMAVKFGLAAGAAQAEAGPLTQTSAAIIVWLGAVSAMVTKGGLAVTLGAGVRLWIAERVSPRVVRYVASRSSSSWACCLCWRRSGFMTGISRVIHPALDRKSAIRFIVCFGLVSLFADMTYEGAHGSIGPLLDGLGASVAAIAFISGFGEMIAASLRFFSGRLADRTHAYWTLAIAGYAMNVLAIPGLAFVTTWQAAAVLIIIERTGKALRGPARDVLLSEATGTVGHGWGFGIHAAMDQTGAFLGPLVMALLMVRSGNVQTAFAWLAILMPPPRSRLSCSRRAVRPVEGVEPPPSTAPLALLRVFWTYHRRGGFARSRIPRLSSIGHLTSTASSASSRGGDSASYSGALRPSTG